MSDEIRDEEVEVETNERSKADSTSLYERDRAYKASYARTRDHKASVRAYCGNNKWAIENAKGSGNW